MRPIFTKVSNRLTALALGGVVALSAATLAFTEKPNRLDVEVDQRPLSRQTTETSYSPVVKKVAPAVVKVFTTARVHRAAFEGGRGGDMDQFLRRFFGDQPGRGNGRGMNPRTPGMPQPQGIGSGVIVSKEGYILTNNHVVDGADEVRVALQDGNEYAAKVVGRDPKTDIAVLKIDARNLPSIPMADSEKVEVGDVVLAVGNPFGIGQTVTKGIVSATGRGGTIGLDYEDFIQTDAAINPGNSGGALVDAEGRLIGINTAILSRTGGNQGIGFAIPSNLAHDVMASIVEDGKVERGYLGVMIQDLTPALAEQFNVKQTKGALVGDVTPNSPAQKAGLKDGDVITEFNGKAITDGRRLRLEVARTKPGSTVPVKVLRNGSSKTIQVAIKQLPGEEQVASNQKESGPSDTGTLNGVAVADLDPQVRRELNVPPHVKGAVISEVEPNSAAAEAGLRPGDVILEINRKPVRNADEAVKLTESTDGKRTLLRVWRDGGSRYVAVDETQAG